MKRTALELRRKYRGIEDEIEVVLESQIKGVVHFKDNNLELDFEYFGDLQVVTLAELKQIPTSYFKNGWLTVTDAESLDDETYVTVEEVLEYCGLTDYTDTYTTTDFKEILTKSDDEISLFVQKLNKKELRKFMHYTSELYKNDEIDYKTTTAIEDGINIENYYYDNFK